MSASFHAAAELTHALGVLRVALVEKAERLGLYMPWGDRGSPCTQLLDGRRLFIYEAPTHGTLWPRLVYELPCGFSGPGCHTMAVQAATALERDEPGRMVALLDRRPPAVVDVFTRLVDFTTPWVPGSNSEPSPIQTRAAWRMRQAADAFTAGRFADAFRLRAEAEAIAGDRAPPVAPELAEARAENADLHATLTKMGGILDGVAVAVRGEPAPNAMHDWSRLPGEVAALAGRARPDDGGGIDG